jgi:CHAT domain-containing protein
MTPITVLFCSANPDGTKVLALDEEFRDIQTKIRAADCRDQVVLVSKWAMRADDLLQALNEHQPQIVHFSGHGNSSHLAFIAENGGEHFVTTEALCSLFRTCRGKIRIALLNACFTATQAEAIAKEIECVIGMLISIGDRAAKVFSASFYRALAFGKSAQEAFDQGIVALQLENIPEDKIPRLFVNKGVVASQLFIINPR